MGKEKNRLFREKSIERISSPDQLNDYIRLSDPGVWFVLGALTLILIGAIVFGVFGHIDSTVPGVGISEGGHMTCLIKKEYADRFADDMTVRIDNITYPADVREGGPVTVSKDTDPYALSVGNLQPGEWVYELNVNGTFSDGAYEASLITERISPLSFLFDKQ